MKRCPLALRSNIIKYIIVDNSTRAEQMTSTMLAIGHEKQLFIDDHAIEELADVRRTFHQAKKHPSNPLLIQRDWWEDYYIQLYGNVLYDAQQQEFRMYYNAISKADI